MRTELSIGRLSKETGVKIVTIRFYEKIGVLDAPPRTASNYRLYSRQHVLRLHFVRRQWSRDGRFIVYSEFDPNTKVDVAVLPMDKGSARKPIPFLHSEFNELFGQLSPHSYWMAYTSDESGQPDVYVRRFPTSEGPLKTFNRWR